MLNDDKFLGTGADDRVMAAIAIHMSVAAIKRKIQLHFDWFLGLEECVEPGFGMLKGLRNVCCVYIVGCEVRDRCFNKTFGQYIMESWVPFKTLQQDILIGQEGGLWSISKCL